MKFNLERFVTAQQNIYEVALSELQAGMKRSHWMWFIFPQLRGLGRSETARFYAISGRAEAEAYLTHPMLGPRLVECTTAMLQHTDLNRGKTGAVIGAHRVQHVLDQRMQLGRVECLHRRRNLAQRRVPQPEDRSNGHAFPALVRPTAPPETLY